MATLEEQIRAQGGDWDIGGVDRAAELADLLRKKGITSWGDLSLTGDYKTDVLASNLNPMSRAGVAGDTDEARAAREANRATANTRQLKIGGKAVGFLGDYNLDGSYGTKASDYLQEGSRIGWSARGDGHVSYNVVTGPDGKVAIVPVQGSSSDLDRLKYPLMGALAFTGLGLAGNAGLLGAGIGSGAGGATTGAAGAGSAAAAGGGTAAAGGGTGLLSAGATPGFELGGLIAGGSGAAPSAGALGAGLGATEAAGLVGGGLLTAPGAAGAASGGLLSTVTEAAKSGWNWLTGSGSAVEAGGKLFGNSLLRDLMPLIGAGVSQYTAEKLTEEQREWIEKQQADARRRQKPVKAPGMFFSVKKGKSGG